MRHHAAGRAILRVEIDRRRAEPLARQIAVSIAAAIRDGRLRAGATLPSTRALAGDLGVARATVVAAFDQLRDEGFVESARGRAARVTARGNTSDPRAGDTATPPPRHTGAASSASTAPRTLSRRGARLADLPDDVVAPFLGRPPRPFRSGVPALDLFPVDIWGRLLARAWRRSSPRLLGYGEPHGHPPLRAAIAAYLRSARGIHCTEDQIVILAGAQQAIDVIGRVLLDDGDEVWLEDPGYPIAARTLAANGQTVVPVPVDDEGLDVRAGMTTAPRARLAYVTPARQVPLGVVLSDARRDALVEWAGRTGAWVFEDDYDSDLQYASRPPLPLMARDRHGAVLLAGTFSKVLFPALRLGYLVAPPALVPAIARARSLVDIAVPHLQQAVLADFMTEGHFERHIRRMRAVYHRRHDLLVRSLKRRLGPEYEVSPGQAGMNLTLWLPPGANDQAIAAAGPAAGLDLVPISSFYLRREAARPGLLLGFGGIREADLEAGARRLAALLARA